MFDVLTREVAVRFNLGDKALPLLQMLLACMTPKDTGGGLPGFLAGRRPQRQGSDGQPD